MRRVLVVCLLILSSTSAYGSDKPALEPAPGSPMKWEGAPGMMDAGDINGDGALDLLVTNYELGRVGIFFGDNTGRFTLSEHTFPNKSSMVKLLDANEDGKLDAAAIKDNSYDVDILLGDSTGKFTVTADSPFKMKIDDDPRPWGFAVQDLNGDGHADVLSSNNLDGDVSGAFGNGKGQFTMMPKPFATGEEPFNVIVRDVNGDGHSDICTPTSEGKIAEVTILYGDGKGEFTRGKPFEGAPDPWWVAAGDVNGDKKLDLATIQVEMPLVTVGLGDGKGNFAIAPGSPFKPHGIPFATHIDLGDANGDGRMDVFLSHDRRVVLYYAKKNGELELAPGSPFPAGPGAWRFVLGDFNKDGKTDIVTGGNPMTVLLAR